MSITGIIDKVLGIFQKKAKLKMDPSYQNETRIKAIDREEENILYGRDKKGDTNVRLATLRAERKQLLEEQARIAARAS